MNTTLSDNEANGFGGGIYTRRSMSLTNVSIVENAAPPRGPENIGKGAGIYQQFGPTNVTTATNVLLARNVNGACGGTANNPIDSRQGMLDEPLPATTCATDPAFNFLVADAVVGPLTDNGGLTRTHALLAGSPAIDRGQSCPSDDQRGVSRPQGGACDIGAYEYVPPPSSRSRRRPAAAADDELPQPEAGKTVNVLPKGHGQGQAAGPQPLPRARRGRADPGRDGRRHHQGPRDAGRGTAGRPRTSTTASSGSARARAPSR